MIRRKIDTEYDQMYEGQVITLDEGQGLYLACCDCGFVHYVEIKIVGLKKGKRKIILDMKRDVNETNKIRSQGITEIEDGYKVKVTKVYNTKKEKCHENHNIRFKGRI